MTVMKKGGQRKVTVKAYFFSLQALLMLFQLPSAPITSYVGCKLPLPKVQSVLHCPKKFPTRPDL